MAAGDPIQKCALQLSAEQLFGLVVVEGTDGKPAIRVYDPVGGGGGGGGGDATAANQLLQLAALAPANSTVTTEYFTGGDNAATIAAFSTWVSNNPAKKVIGDPVQLTGNDGVTGILVRWIA